MKFYIEDRMMIAEEPVEIKFNRGVTRVMLYKSVQAFKFNSLDNINRPDEIRTKALLVREINLQIKDDKKRISQGKQPIHAQTVSYDSAKWIAKKAKSKYLIVCDTDLGLNLNSKEGVRVDAVYIDSLNKEEITCILDGHFVYNESSLNMFSIIQNIDNRYESINTLKILGYRQAMAVMVAYTYYKQGKLSAESPLYVLRYTNRLLKLETNAMARKLQNIDISSKSSCVVRNSCVI